MGGKRTKSVKRGDSRILYIPNSISQEALKWLNDQPQISPSIISLIEKEANCGQVVSENKSIDSQTREAIVVAIEETINKVLGKELSYLATEISVTKPRKKMQKLKNDEKILFGEDMPNLW